MKGYAKNCSTDCAYIMSWKQKNMYEMLVQKPHGKTKRHNV